MFVSLRDKFHSFQENLTTTLKGLSSGGEPLNRRQIFETVSINLNAGSDVLDRFQTAWSELHEASQENATKAEEVDNLVVILHKKTEKHWRDIKQLASNLTSLPEVIHHLDGLCKQILVLEKLFETIEKALTQLEDIKDIKDFQNRQLEQRFQLALYEEKKLASLENVKIKLAEELAEKVRRHEVRQQNLLRECQLASEENFKEDIKVYKETNIVPRIEFIKSNNENITKNDESLLEDVVLDDENTSALDAFLNDTKDSEVELANPKSSKSESESESSMMEEIILKSEALNV